MPSRRPRPAASPTSPEADPEPSGLLGDAEPAAWGLGEWLRRGALGLAAALIVARAYWPAEFRTEAESGSGLLWALMMLIAATLGVAAMWLAGGPRLRVSRADLGVVALVGLVIVSASHAAEKRIAINFAWEWLGVGIGYVLIRNLPRTRGESSAIAAALLATAVAVSAYGHYQVDVEHPEMRDMYRKNPRAVLSQAGLDPDLGPGDPERKRFEDRLLGSREPVATFALANTLAGFLVGPTAAGLSLALRALTRREARKALPLLLAAVPLLSLSTCLLMTKSRSAYLGLLVAMLVLAWRERRRVPARVLALGALGVVASAALLVVAAAMAGKLDKQVLTESTKSLVYRAEYWRGAWGVIWDGPNRWLSGLGPGNFAGPYLRHKLPQASEEISDPHNLVLEVWATAGLPAVLALAAALGFGLREVFGPPRIGPEEARDEAEAAGAPRSSAWLVVAAGLGGWLLVAALGRLNPFGSDGTNRWLILGLAWGAAVVMGRPLWKRGGMAADVLGLGVVAIAVNLLAAGGIGFAPVSLMLWGLLGLGQNLREDRRCSVRRPVGGRGLAFGFAAVAAATIGTFFGTVPPFWKAEAAIAAAEAALTGPVAKPERADKFYLRAVLTDPLGSRARIARANLEFREWQRRGRPAEDLAWHRIDSGLKSALKLPLDPNNLLVQRLRARFAREFLDLPNLLPAERFRIRTDRLDACLAACSLYPTDATLRADLAEAHADLDQFAKAAEEAHRALDLNRTTPHADKKLREDVRARLRGAIPNWEALKAAR